MRLRANRVLLAYFIAVGGIVLVLAFGQWQAPLLAMLSAAVLIAADQATRSRFGRLIRDFVSIPLIVVGYETSAALTRAVGAPRLDLTMSRIDARWLGALAHHWRFAMGRPTALTELACVSYASFYVLPIVLAATLYRRNREAFDAFLRSAALVFVLSWIGYALFPTTGPRDELALGTGIAGRALAAWLRIVEQNRFDAFPSGHTAIAVVMAWHAGRRLPRLAPLFVGCAAAIIFSTVYLSFHYVADVLAGAGIAGGVLALGPRGGGSRVVQFPGARSGFTARKWNGSSYSAEAAIGPGARQPRR